MTQTEQEGMPQQSENEDSLASFTSKAVRRPKSGSYEQLLCQHLMTSVSTFSTEKIRLICEAAYMVVDSPVDADMLEVIYKVVMSFRTTEVKVTDPERFPGVIAWSFSCNKENYEKYITPWIHSLKRLYYNTDRRNAQYESKLAKIIEKIDGEEDGFEKYQHEYFWHLTTECAAVSSLEVLKSKFVSWAMPHTMRMFEQLTKLVNPKIYNELAERVKL